MYLGFIVFSCFIPSLLPSCQPASLSVCLSVCLSDFLSFFLSFTILLTSCSCHLVTLLLNLSFSDFRGLASRLQHCDAELNSSLSTAIEDFIPWNKQQTDVSHEKRHERAEKIPSLHSTEILLQETKRTHIPYHHHQKQQR